MLNHDADIYSATDHGSQTVIDLLRKKASHQRNRLAYTFLPDGDAEKAELTYEELDRRSRAIGASLQLAGATGGRVLLLYPHGLEFITAFLGCLYAGAIAVPAYPPRLNRSQLRLQKIIDDTQAAMALTTNAALARAERVFRETPAVNNLKWLATDRLAGGLEEKWREPAINGDTLAMIQYTSGSTSAPKGVMVSHNNLLVNQRMIRNAFRQTEQSIIVGWLPLYHDMGLIGNVLQPLFLGARCVLMSPTAFLQKPSRWLQAISDYRATTSGGPNFAYDLCARKITPDERARLDLSCWTTAFNGAEPIFHETMERFAAAFATCGFRREAFYPCYGLAEATLLVSAGRNSAQLRGDKEIVERNHLISPPVNVRNRIIVSCGQVLPSERVAIVDPESSIQYPDGTLGEIWVSGPNVARGYWNRELETEQTFGAYLGESGEGPFLRTGDLGYIKNGELFVAGRIKDLIIVRGRNHYPQDIELTVQQSDPALESGSCAAFSIEVADEERLVIVKELTHTLEDPNSLIDSIQEAVAREHEVQAHAIALVNKGSIPKTTSGKIQRYECRNQYQAGNLAAVAEWHENLTSEVGPRNSSPAKKLLTTDAIAIDTIQNSLLSFLAAKQGRGAERVSVDKPLLSYGIDSLTAIELSHHLESRFGVVLPAVSLLEDATISQIARQAVSQMKGASCYSRPTFTQAPKGVTDHPLSYGQRSLWFLYQLAPLGGAYNVSSAVRIRSALAVGVLRRALQKIVDRHDSLRTTFLSEGGEPFQRVGEKVEVSLREVDISSWGDEFLDDYLIEEAHRPFSLEQGPLMRVILFSRSPHDHFLLLVAHHIVVDLWSLGALIHELGFFYRSEQASTEASLDALTVRYVDYVYWQRRLLAGQEGERLWSYWQSQLAGDLGTLDLPADRPRPSFQTFRGALQPIYLSMDLTQSLRSLGQNRRATLYVTLQAIFHALLHRYTGQEDILVGTPMAGRSATELSRLIGYFVNLVVLRADLSGAPTFSALLERVREMTLAAFAHQDYPFALLVERLQPAHDPSRSPLFQVEFALQKAPALGEEVLASQALIEGARMNFGGLSAESIVLRRRPSRFDLSLFVVEAEDGLKGFIEYNADLFDEWRIRRMAEHFRRLAEVVTANPGMRIHELDLMSAEEREQLVVEFNRTEREYDGEQRVHEMIEAQAENAPEAIALTHEDKQLTYAELNTKANQLARYLQGLGVGPEVVVGLCLERSIEMVVALLGALKAGGAYLPLDPGHPIERLGYMLEDAGVWVVLTERKLEGRLPAYWGQTLCLDVEWEKISEEGDGNPAPKVEAENLAYVIYTSGSTGRPKGVMINHRGLVNYLKWATEAYRIENGEGAPVQSSIGFDLTVTSLYGPLVNGRRVNLLSEKEGIEALATALSQERGYSLVKITPAHLGVLTQQLGDSEIEGRTGALVIGGEELKASGLKYWRERARGTRLINEYGPTETVVGCCVYEVNGSESGRETAPIGKPIANTQMYVLDQALEPVPVGVKGEIYISGAGLARGYVRSPELTGEKFIPHRFSRKGGERLYRTGDVGRYLCDGNIEYVGRADNQVKVRGYRVELGEVQAVLEEHRSVRQSVVVVNEDERGAKRLIGYVVGETVATPAELKRHVRERLPEYMVPESIITLGEMPLTANGKVDRKRLPLANDAGRQTGREYVSARTPVEEILAGVFEEALKLDRVGRSDNFFEIGGHSLLATQVASRIKSVFGIGIEVRDIFEEATVEALARRIDAAIRAGEKEDTLSPIRARRDGQKGARLPLSFAQQRLWFVHQLEHGNALYNVPGSVRLEGRLDLRALESAINEIVRRHESLRTRIEVAEGGPAQVVDEWEPRRLEVVDLTDVSPEEREEEAGRIAKEEAGSGFDLSRGPLMRVKVLKLEEERHLVLFTMSHIVSDGWSTEILLREVGALYRAYGAGESSPLEELPIQYADFAVWQREWLKGEALEREMEYWRKQLAGMEALDLPTDHPRPAAPSYRGARRHFVVERELTEKLRALSQREGVTLFMTLLGGFNVLLSRYSGQGDVALGTDIANRNRAEIEGLIGFFVNQLVMRVEVRARERFGELLSRVREVCLGAYAHQDLPFEKLVEELQPGRDLGRAPLFQVKLIWQNAPREGLELEGMRLSGIEVVELQTSKLDLTASITDAGHDLKGAVSYSRDLFEEETIERLVRHYTNVLREIVEDSERPISDLNLLGDREREQIVVEWNRTGASYPQDRCIHDLYREQAERTPERMALICNEQQMIYGDLNRRANQLGHYLQGLGVGPEVVVGLCLERSVQMMVAVLGALKAGGAYLPLDPAYPLERLSYLLEDAGVGVVLTERKFEERLPAFWGQTICLDREWERIGEESESEPDSGVVPENLAYVIYTSGSTGRPKGVMVRHRSLVNYTRDICRQLGLGEGGGEGGLSFATVSTLTADLGNTCIYPSLLSGGCLHVLSYEVATDGGRFEEYLRKDPIDVLKIVPSHLGALLGTQPAGTPMLPHRRLILGGEALSPELVERIREAGESCEVINHYGPTETTIGSLMGRVREEEERGRRSATVPIGRPIANTAVYVLDRELEPVPVGARGELYIAGEGVARGYLGRPELTAERFIPDLLGAERGERLYRTGDVVRYLSDGRIEFLGRADDQVKVRGYRIELGEIKAALDEHPLVRQSVVIASEDERGGMRLIGYVVGEEGATAAELKRHVRERLPEYMVPEVIMTLEEMPLTTNGKIDRKRLPLLKDADRQVEQGNAGARTPFEEIVIGIFGEVLKVDRVGIHDNFFEIGGHSLLATQVVSRVRNTFGVEIGVGSVFETATAEGLARKIEEAIGAGEKDGAPPLVSVSRDGQRGNRLPLSFAQQRLWFLDQLAPNNPFYNCPRVIRLEGRLNLDALESVVNEIVRRHEALRTRIEVEAGVPAQVIDEWKPRRLEVVVLTGLPREERAAEVSRIAKEEAMKGFDLRRGPLLRVKILKLAEEEHLALFTTHHIVSDGWSMGILIREVGALYQAYSEGNASPLEEPEIQYADFAVWQREWLKGKALEREIEYWRKQLAGAEALKLPTDHPRLAAPRYRGAEEEFLLETKLAADLRELSRQEGATLFMTLLAAFQSLLYRYTGQEDIVVGTDIANRNRSETENLIGFFVNQLALRTNLGGDPTFRELLGRVRRVTLEAYAHQELPFEKVVEILRPERSLSHMPLFQVKVLMDNTPAERLKLPGLKLEALNAANGTSRFDLTLTMSDTPEGLRCVFNYDKDLFDASVARMRRHFEALLNYIVTAPDATVKDLKEKLDESDKEQWGLKEKELAEAGLLIFKSGGRKTVTQPV